ncbi:MAG: Hsp70 family protein, partial [Proteobacteria bacterium]|nr:Hsp70 family protein [Pseudomonadota bacterium]
MTKPLIYAIDFGTSNTLLAAANANGVLPPVELDVNSDDKTILKSLFYTPDQNEWYFGSEAIHQYTERAAEGRFFRSIKKFLPEPGFSGTAVHGRFIPIHQIIGVFLKEVRNRANLHFGCDVTAVTMGRPAVFGDNQTEDSVAEKRLKQAAEYAGFKDVYFCPEPVAAAYEFRHQLKEEKNVLIADFGGGTSDFTVLKMGPNQFSDQDILATYGVSIAGDKFDGSIMKHHIAPHFGSEITFRLPRTNGDMRIPLRLLSYLTSPADIAFLSKTETMSFLKEAQK